MINARAESLTEKPAFKHLVGSRRCIIPLITLLEGQVLQSNIPACRAKISVSTCDDCVLKIDLFNGIKQ